MKTAPLFLVGTTFFAVEIHGKEDQLKKASSLPIGTTLEKLKNESSTE